MRITACLMFALLISAAARAPSADDGLVASWRFDKAAAQAQDLTGKGHAAAVTGGQVVTEDGRTFLRMDGKTRIDIPSSPDLNLRRGFSLEARVRPTDLSDGRNIFFKLDEYMVRIDWPKETSHLSFFVHQGGEWEPRVSAAKPIEGRWLHIVAVWDGTQEVLWVNGLPHALQRIGDAPPATNNPLCIGSSVGFGAGFIGDIEYAKVYDRALTSSEVLSAAYGLGEKPRSSASTESSFDFRTGPHGWAGREGAEASTSADGLLVKAPMPDSLLLHDHLDVDVAKRDFVTVRMAVDKGSRGTLVFATTAGASRVPFQTYADGRMHTYVLEAWQHVGWGGKLLALGVVPAEVEQSTARLQYVRVTEEPSGEGEVVLQRLFTDSVLPRAGRSEKILARLTNSGGPASKVKVTLRVPDGFTLTGPATQTSPSLGYLQSKEITWVVRSASPRSGRFIADVSGPQIASASLSEDLSFQPAINLAKASYVPEPVPVDTGKYMILTHYCPLWKHGTHLGWKAIEPYPERKPVLGWYNEGTPEVADWHIKYWLEHGIQGAVYCWYRSSINGPVQQSLGHAIHDGLLKARYLSKIKFAIMWENGCGQGVGSVQDLMDNVLPFWLDNYFTHPSYLKIDGKPVLYIWVPSIVTKQLGGSENVRKTFDAMRAKARERGLAGLYIVGCIGTADRDAIAQMATEGWDATSAYGNGWVPPQQTKTVGNFTCAPVESFVDQQATLWKAKTGWHLLPDIVSAMMGWDSRPWNETPFFFSGNTPATFRDMCQRAKAEMDAKPGDGVDKKTMIFCCWNEFGEGHYIEPTRGYGFSYIDAIRDTFSTAPRKHTDLAPEDVGLGAYDSWYAKAKAAAPVSEVSTQSSWSGEALAAWTGFMGLDQVGVTTAGMRAVSNTPDPALSSPALKIRARLYSKVVLNMRVSEASDAQLFWSTISTPGANEAASLHAKTIADGQFHRYVFEVGKNEYWGGCVTGMRLDPADRTGITVEIASISLE
jgi:hypothetical protein